MIADIVSRWEQFGDWRVAVLVGFVAVLVGIGVLSWLIARRRNQPTPEEQSPEGQSPKEQSSEQLSLREHFRELRSRVLICMVALLLGSAVCFYFYEEILNLLITPARNVAGDDVAIIYTEVTELLSTTVKVSLLGGLVLALPIILYNVIRFVAPGLTPKERRVLFTFLPAALLAFVGGMAFGYFVMIPPALKFLLTFGGDVAEPLIRISNIVNIMIRLLFWLGIAFETPLVMFVLATFGIVNARGFSRFRRLWLVVSFIIAAAITPTIDPLNQAIVAGPLIVLYELGVLLARFADRRSAATLNPEPAGE